MSPVGGGCALLGIDSCAAAVASKNRGYLIDSFYPPANMVELCVLDFYFFGALLNDSVSLVV